MRTKDLINLEEAVNKVYLKEEESYDETATTTLTVPKHSLDHLLQLIMDPTKYENQTDEEWHSSGLREVARQLDNALGNPYKGLL